METDKDKVIKDLREELDKRFSEITLIMKVNVDLRKEIRQLEKLVELNMKDFWEVVQQRDQYYEELKSKQMSPSSNG